MFQLLRKWFIKSDDVTSLQVRTRYGMLCGIIGIITNSLLSIVKIIAGIFSASIAILADGINNLSDSASSLVTLIAFRIARSPADQKHPYGHQRIEYISGLIVSFGIVVVGIVLAQSSIQKIINPEPIDTTHFYLLVVMLVAAILIKWWQSRFYKKTGKLINSKALMATSMDSLSDVLTTSVVLIAIVLAKYSTINIDGVMGLVVSIFITYNGLKLIKETVSPLLGEAPPQEFIDNILKKIKSYEGVLGVHDLVIHSYGPAKIFITVHVEVDAKEDIITSHDLIDKIELDFLKNHNFNVVIHMDPVDKNDAYVMELKEQVHNIIQAIDTRLDFHDFRIIRSKKNTSLLFDLVVPNDYELPDKEIKEKIIKNIKKINQNFLVTIIVDHHYMS